MKKYTIRMIIVSMLLLLSVISCSDDNPLNSRRALIGTWDLTATRVDGVISTPETDPVWKFYEDEVLLVFRNDGTGVRTNNGSIYEFTNWHTEGDELVVTGEDGGIGRVKFLLLDNTLTLIFPKKDSDPYNIPDLIEEIFTRQ